MTKSQAIFKNIFALRGVLLLTNAWATRRRRSRISSGVSDFIVTSPANSSTDIPNAFANFRSASDRSWTSPRLSITPMCFVRGVIDSDEVRRGVLRSTPLPDSHLQEIARAPMWLLDKPARRANCPWLHLRSRRSLLIFCPIVSIRTYNCNTKMKKSNDRKSFSENL